jgi:hypothetical protein
MARVRAAVRIFAALLSFTLLSFAMPAFGQDETVFRSGVSLVRVDAEVLGADGTILENLQAADFRLLDQGAEQPLTSVTFEREPLDLILLFDISGSMRGKLLSIVRAVELGFHELKAGDRVCVMTFGPGTAELLPFTDDMERANQVIFVRVPGLRFGGGSDSEQAATDAAVRFRKEPKSARRRAVLVITDRLGSAGGGVAAAVRNLWQSDAVLGELVIGSGKGTDQMAQRTGGSTIFAGGHDPDYSPGTAFQRSVRLLRRRYTLYYSQPSGAAGVERSIEVHLSGDAAKRNPGATVRARSGYIVPSQ